MVQNIRPPQSFYVPQHQPPSDAKPVGRGASKVETELTAPTAPTPVSTPAREDVEQAAIRIKEVLRGTTSRLEIEIDHDLHKAVIKVFSVESGEIIRQIPSQELLDLAKHLDEVKGLLVHERA
jgi:flagellar protein FlaG